MKTILKLIFTVYLFFGCTEKPGIELIKPVDDNYPSIKELGRIESIIVSGENISKISKDLKDVVGTYKTDEDFLKANYILFISEQGKIEKLLVLENTAEGLPEKLLTSMEKWQFEEITKNSQPLKYRFEWTFSLQRNSKKTFDLISSNLPLPVEKDGEQFYTSVEEMPEPIGGISAIQRKVNYPEIAKREGIQGRVFVKALVNKDGIVVETDIIRGIEGGCNEAAMSAVKATEFSPARLNGEPVNAQVIVPILFRLQ